MSIAISRVGLNFKPFTCKNKLIIRIDGFFKNLMNAGIVNSYSNLTLLVFYYLNTDLFFAAILCAHVYTHTKEPTHTEKGGAHRKGRGGENYSFR